MRTKWFVGFCLSVACTATTCVFSHTPVGAATSSQSSAAVSSVRVVEKQFQAKHVDVSYPQIAGMASIETEAKLNDLLRKASIPHMDAPTPGAAPTDFSSWYNVLLQRGNLVEVMLTSYSYMQGAAHGMPGKTVYLINTKLGTVYKLSDLFQSGTAYLKQTSDLIRKQDSQHVLNSFSKFTGVTNQDQFYLTDDALYVYFSPYQWTPYVLGFPEYRLPYQQMMNIIDRNGSLWKELHSPQSLQQKQVEDGHRAKIQSLGYTIVSKQNAETPVNASTVLYAVDAKPKSAADGTLEKVFFFVDNRYLGMDTLRDHAAISNIYPVDRGTIGVTYFGNSGRFTIQYHWNGKRLILNKPFPSSYGVK